MVQLWRRIGIEGKWPRHPEGRANRRAESDFESIDACFQFLCGREYKWIDYCGRDEVAYY